MILFHWTKADAGRFEREGIEMLIEACSAKIHQAKVTNAVLDYVGSITIDEEILEACGMLPLQYVNITNISNGVFWRTYIMPGKRGDRDICLNGPPAHHFQKGDRIIILAEVWLEPKDIGDLELTVVVLNEFNEIIETIKKKAISSPKA
jgi:aspartate 1-decarboxylase